MGSNSTGDVAAEPPVAPPATTARTRKWHVFAAIGLSYFVTVAAMTFSVLALPAIAEEFRVTLRAVGWVVIVESLIVAAFLLPLGGLSDVVGRRRTLVVGVIVFGSGLILTGVAPSFVVLIGARVVTAFGNTLIQAVGTGILVAAFPKEERGLALGAQTTAVAIGAGVGPLLGGLLLDTLDWQLIYLLIALPTGATLAVLTRVLDSEPRSGAPAGSTFDWAGAVLSAGFVVALVTTVNDPFDLGVGSPVTIVAAVATVGLLLAFVRRELAVPRPMLDVRLFAVNAFRRAVAIRVLGFVASTAVLLLLPVYLISIRSLESRSAGIILALSAVGMAIGAQVSGRLYDRLGPRLPTIVGLLLQAAVLAVLAALDGSSPLPLVTVAAFGSGLSMGSWNVPANSVMLGATPPDALGVGGAFTNVTRTVGNVIGQAGATAIVAGVMVAQGFDIPLGDVADLPDATDAFFDGWRAAFVAATALTLATVVVAARIPSGRPESPSSPVRSRP